MKKVYVKKRFIRQIDCEPTLELVYGTSKEDSILILHINSMNKKLANKIKDFLNQNLNLLEYKL